MITKGIDISGNARFWVLVSAVASVMVAASVIGGPALAGDGCPPGEIALQENRCQVCRFPSTLEATGAVAGDGSACFTCESGGLSDLAFCADYWDDAIDPELFPNHGQFVRTRRHAARWSRAIARGRDDSPAGARMLNRIYRQSLRERLTTQTGALSLIADVSHFGSQLDQPGEWPPLSTRVSFTQIDWMSEPGVPHVAQSGTSFGTLHPGALSPQFLDEQGGAWVNVIVRPVGFSASTAADGPLSTAVDMRPGVGEASFQPVVFDEADWRIRNLFLSFRTAAEVVQSALSALFDLGTPDGAPVAEVEFGFAIADEPSPFGDLVVDPDLVADIDALELEEFLVGGIKQDEAFGGSELIVPDDVEIWDGCPMVDAAPEVCQPAQAPARVQPRSIPLGSVPPINEFDDHCAPSAAARGLKVLLGEDVTFPQDIMEEIRIDMDTNGARTGAEGGGTSVPDIKIGKDAYSARHGLGVSTEIVDSPPFANAVDQAIATLNAGGVVEILIDWFGRNPMTGEVEVTGGHMAFVTEIVRRADGSVQITYVDDHNQGDHTAAADVNVIYCDNLGKFWANVGQVDGFVLETKD